MYRVLFVDDEPWITRGLQVALNWEAEGFVALTENAYDGFQALELIQAQHPNLVVIDISMPEMTGLECIRLAQERGEEYLFIVLTGYADFAYAQQSVELGIVSYLLKPYDKGELQAAVHRAKGILDRRSAPQAPAVTGRHRELIGAVVDYVDRNYARSIRLSDIARELFIRPDYLSVLFKKSMGQTFGEYLAQRRMNVAAALLRERFLSVEEVADRVGYSDAANFTKSFKKHFGITPARYRDGA